MGFVSQIFGTNGAGAQSAKIDTPVTADQANATLGTAQSAQQQQANLSNQLAAQNGAQNQSQVFNQLGQVANGSVNPAQDQLNQNTAANTATQASLMAGQRGVGDNAGLIARQAAMQGAANQQSAIGQAATAQSTNQLNAMGQQATIANQQVGNAITNNQNQAANANALYGAQTSAINGTNNAQVQNTASTNSYNQAAMQSQNALVGGLIGGAGAAMMAAKGGTIPNAPAASGSITEQLKQAKMMKAGGVVPGQAKVAHDSYANDTVNAKLSPGEVVIDKDTLAAKGKVGDAARLLQAYLAKSGHKPAMVKK